MLAKGSRGRLLRRALALSVLMALAACDSDYQRPPFDPTAPASAPHHRYPDNADRGMGRHIDRALS